MTSGCPHCAAMPVAVGSDNELFRWACGHWIAKGDLFEVGEIINPDDCGLRVQITALDPIEAVVVKNTEPTSYVGKFFPVGKPVRFIRCHLGTSWRIDTDDKDMPWYILGIYEGRKCFEHYR